MKKNYKTWSGTVFLIIALIHLWRVFQGWTVTVNTTSIPMWASWAAVLIAGCFAYHGLKKN